MSTFGNILRGVSTHVLNSALNSAMNAANRTVSEHTVQEITGKSNFDEVANYPVSNREGCLILHGPIPEGRFYSKPTVYNIILHVPSSPKMFSMYRTDKFEDATIAFILYKETFPVLVNCDPSICELDKLERIAKILRENKGWTAPHVAAALGFQTCLKHALLKNRLNEQDGETLRTPLLVAINSDCLASVAILLESGVQVDIKDVRENTIFHLAAGQSLQIMQILLDKIPLRFQDLINHLNAEGFTPLHLACKQNRPEILKALMGSGANVNIASNSQGYPIHCAVKASSVCSVQELISQNPNQLTFRDLNEGGSPLHWPSGPETLLPLLELGCDPNIVNDSGSAPLHNTVRLGCLKSTLHLLCHGAFPDMKGGENDETPLHVAARLCSKTIMQALIVFGADINMTNKNGDTPRHLVCTSQRSDKDESLFILSAVGAKRCHESRKGHCVDGCKFDGLLEGIAPTNFPNYFGTNLLHNAMQAFSIQREVTERMERMDCDSASNNNTQVGGHVGGRLLCLDGGGIRGIILTQMLIVMEQELGDSIVNTFDWVAGTSTGGILALALASGKSAVETQGIYLRLKDKVFVGDRPYSATVMEDFLKQEFGSDKKMSSIKRPKVMIMTAIVDRRPVDLHIFRNYKSPLAMLGETEPCAQDPETQFVWEAAKVTGAAPSYFRLDHNQFIDGGLIANNPTLDALTELQHFCTVMKSLGVFTTDLKVPTAVVSLGTGIQPRTEANVSLLDITWPSGLIDAINKVSRLTSLVNLLVDQATQSEGQVVERSRAWCSSIGVPFFRFSPQMSCFVELDEKDDEKLINLLWETRCYMIANKQDLFDMKKVLFDKGPPLSV